MRWQEILQTTYLLSFYTILENKEVIASYQVGQFIISLFSFFSIQESLGTKEEILG